MSCFETVVVAGLVLMLSIGGGATVLVAIFTVYQMSRMRRKSSVMKKEGRKHV